MAPGARTLLALFFVSAATVSSNQSTSQAPPITLQEPDQIRTFFRVDPTTGVLSGVEAVKKTGTKKVGGLVHQGFLKPDAQLYTTFIEGAAASPIRFSAGESQAFVVRYMGRTPESKEDKRMQTLEEARSEIRLMRLSVQDGKRFISRISIPLDVQSYGQLVIGLSPKFPTLGTQSFKLTPRTQLAPGEYGLGKESGPVGSAESRIVVITSAFGIGGSAPLQARVISR